MTGNANTASVLILFPTGSFPRASVSQRAFAPNGYAAQVEQPPAFLDANANVLRFAERLQLSAQRPTAHLLYAPLDIGPFVRNSPQSNCDDPKSTRFKPDSGTKTEVSHRKFRCRKRFQIVQPFDLAFCISYYSKPAACSQSGVYSVGYLCFRARIRVQACTHSLEPRKAAILSAERKG